MASTTTSVLISIEKHRSHASSAVNPHKEIAVMLLNTFSKSPNCFFFVFFLHLMYATNEPDRLIHALTNMQYASGLCHHELDLIKLSSALSVNKLLNIISISANY